MKNGTPIPLVTDESVDQMVRIGRGRSPSEACGVLTVTGEVIELPNRAMDPVQGYELWVEDFEPHWEEGIIIWHTHPSGWVGPSRGDMRTRLQGVHYLVVTLDGMAALY